MCDEEFCICPNEEFKLTEDTKYIELRRNDYDKDTLKVYINDVELTEDFYNVVNHLIIFNNFLKPGDKISVYYKILNSFYTKIDRINNTNKSRENFKEEIAYNISYNNSNALSVIDEIYRYNPDRNTRIEIDPEFIFNTPLISNGKTLLYIACQEGKEDIVEYFLNKKFKHLHKFPTYLQEQHSM